MMQAFKSMAILGLFLLSCQDASFVTGVKKKSQDSIPAQDKPQDLPAQPESPHDDSSEETNCTDLKAEDCKKKKEEEGSSTSFRDVDCQGKDQEACEKLIEEQKKMDANNGSEIRVKNCSSDISSLCESNSNNIFDENSKLIKDPSGLIVDEGGSICLEQTPALDIIFVIDRSISMSSTIGVIRKNLEAFVGSLKNIVPKGTTKRITDIRLGAITFIDDSDDIRTYPLASPFELMKNLETSTSGGSDHCEGGLQASGIALNQFDKSKSKSKVRVPVLVFISDNYAHDGVKQSPRNLSPSFIEKAIKSKQFNHLLVYDSVPFSSSDVKDWNVKSYCQAESSGFFGPGDQWKRVRESWSKTRPKVKGGMGKNIGFPLTGSSLLNGLVNDLSGKFKVCGK